MAFYGVQLGKFYELFRYHNIQSAIYQMVLVLISNLFSYQAVLNMQIKFWYLTHHIWIDITPFLLNIDVAVRELNLKFKLAI